MLRPIDLELLHDGEELGTGDQVTKTESGREKATPLIATCLICGHQKYMEARCREQPARHSPCWNMQCSFPHLVASPRDRHYRLHFVDHGQWRKLQASRQDSVLWTRSTQKPCLAPLQTRRNPVRAPTHWTPDTWILRCTPRTRPDVNDILSCSDRSSGKKLLPLQTKSQLQGRGQRLG